MTDERLRRGEREQDVEGQARWLTEALRSGALSPARLTLAARLGHPAAAALDPQGPLPEDVEDFVLWLEEAAGKDPEVALRMGLALLSEIPVYLGSDGRFDGPDDRLLAAFEALAGWATGERDLERLAAVQAELGGAAGYGHYVAVNCTLALLRIPPEPELALSHLREAARLAAERARLGHLLRSLQRELWPWLLGDSDPLADVLALRGGRLLGRDGIVRGLGFAGERLWASWSTGPLQALTRDGAVELELPLRARDVYAFAVGPGPRLAVGQIDGACEVWADPEQAGLAFSLEATPHALSFDPGGNWLWAGTSTGRVIGVDLALGAQAVAVEVAERTVTALCALPGELWAGAREGWLVALATAGRELRRIGPLEEDPSGLVDLGDGRLVVGLGNALGVFDAERGVELSRVLAHERGTIYDLARVPGRPEVVTACGDRELAWVDLDQGRVLRRWRSPAVLLRCAVTPDGREAISGARSGLLRRHPLRV
ncbi:MAG: hypothetical protein R3F62_26480 [Planctomycetota bacterium]